MTAAISRVMTEGKQAGSGLDPEFGRGRADGLSGRSVSTARDMADTIAVGHGEPVHLDAILQPHVALSLWWRPPPVGLMAADIEGFGRLRLHASVEHVLPALRSAAASLPHRAWQDAVFDDIAALARRYATIMAVGEVEIRLDQVSGNACWKFHSDYVRARLITTYYGPGTEWAIQEGVELGRAHRLAAGHVGIFKGRVWAPEARLLHRSPPIADTGDVRLLLVIDTLKKD